MLTLNVFINYQLSLYCYYSSFTNSLQWDTGGQEQFHSIVRTFYNGAHGIFLVYDVTKESSYFGLDFWKNEISQFAPSDCVIALVGNKTDLEGREVKIEDAKELAQENKMLFQI